MKNLTELKEQIAEAMKQLTDAIETICKDYESRQKSEPELNGQWGAYNDGGIIYPFLIHHYDNDDVYGQDFRDPDNLYKVDAMCINNNLIRPSEKQIEAHLKKICNRMYNYGKR